MAMKLLEIFGGILIMFFVIGVHELGHLVTGLVQGFRFELFVLGPLGIKREKNKLKVYLNKNLQYYGGVAATLPRKDDPGNSRKLANILLAGPMTSLLLALILGILYFSLNFKVKLIAIGAIGSLGIFLATTLPGKTGMFFTDRKRYQRLTSDGPEREVELAVLRIIGNYGKDNSYINVEAHDIDTMISDDNYKYLGLFTKLTYQFEKHGEFDPETQNEFIELSKKMPKFLVKTSNKELEKLKSKEAIDNSSNC